MATPFLYFERESKGRERERERASLLLSFVRQSKRRGVKELKEEERI